MSARYRTRGFHALAHDFRIVAESEAIGRHFERVLDGFPRCDEPAVEYLIRARADDESSDATEVVVEGGDAGDEVVVRGTSVGALFGSFVQLLNRKAIDADYGVMAHAGGVERNGVGVVLPADPESGKTTLTAGLVRAGFAYLSDEAVTFDADTRMIEPFPKPLSIDPGSQHLFPELEPVPAPGDERAPSDQWQVPPEAIRPGSVGESCTARFIVFPKYREGAITALAPLSRASGLVELATNTFHFRDHPRRSLDVLARVVERAQCFRLAVGSLEDACVVIDALVTDGVEARRV
jgi:hypothetical protein